MRCDNIGTKRNYVGMISMRTLQTLLLPFSSANGSRPVPLSFALRTSLVISRSVHQLWFFPFPQDGQALNVNHSDPLGLSNVTIPHDFLTKTYLGRCSFDYKGDCSGPQGEIADFNVWDRALSQGEMERFTTCK